MSVVTVTGRGNACAPVDTAEIRVSVQSVEKAGERAVAETDRKVKELKQALAEKGFDENHLHTARFAVRAEYEDVHQNGKYTRTQKGFRCEQQLKLEFPYTAERLSAALSVLSAGGELQIFFKAGSAEGAAASALENAYRDAKSKAEALARASGKTLGNLVRIFDSETASRPSANMARGEAVMLCASPAEINPEDECVNAVIGAEWDLI